MKFNIINTLKFQISVLYFLNKQCKLIRNIIFFKIVIDIFFIPEDLVDIHKINFMTERMKNQFIVCCISGMIKDPFKFVKIDIGKNPFLTEVLFFKPKIDNDVNLLFFVGKWSCYFCKPVSSVKIKINRIFFIEYLVDE